MTDATIYPTLEIPETLAAGPEPGNTDARVLAAFATSGIADHMQADVLRCMIECKQMLHQVWGTRNTYTFGVAGTGWASCLQKGGECCVVKAQVHAGGRGKAGGVKVCDSDSEIQQVTEGMFGRKLVTHQTGAAGRRSAPSPLFSVSARPRSTFVRIPPSPLMFCVRSGCKQGQSLRPAARNGLSACAPNLAAPSFLRCIVAACRLSRLICSRATRSLGPSCWIFRLCRCLRP